MVKARKVRRFRPRFTLFAMLVLITLVAIPLGYVAQRRSWNLQRKAAYEALRDKGVQFSWELIPKEDDTPTLQAWWRDLISDEWSMKVESVSISDAAERDHRNNRGVTDDDLRLLRCFPEIFQVTIGDTRGVTDAGLRYVAELPMLSKLSLSRLPGVDGSFLGHFGSRNSLEVLEIHGGNFDIDSLEPLSRFSELRYLSLVPRSDFSNRVVVAYPLPRTIQHLDLTLGQSVTPKTIRLWLQNCRLRSLSVSGMPREAIATLESQADLEDLTLCDCTLVDEDLGFLERCNHLKQLSLMGMPIEGKFLSWIGAPEKLESLRLDCAPISDRNLVHLRRFSNLDSLELRWTPISGEGFAELGSFPKPCLLRLLGCQFSPAGKKALAKCGNLGQDFEHNLELPRNWTLDDLSYFEGRHDAVHTSLPLSATLESLKTKSPYGKFYGFNLHCRDVKQYALLGHSPKELMATVIRLLDEALAYRSVEEEQEAEFWEIQRLEQQQKEATQ